MTIKNLKQLIREPTRVTNDVATCLDLILTPSEEIVSSVSVLPPICSDYMVPCVKIKTNHKPKSTFKRTIFKYAKIDAIKFQELLQDIDLNRLVTENTVEKAAEFFSKNAELFSENMLDAAKKCMPIKDITIRSNDSPWITDKIIELKEKKKKYTRLQKDLTRPLIGNASGGSEMIIQMPLGKEK